MMMSNRESLERENVSIGSIVCVVVVLYPGGGATVPLVLGLEAVRQWLDEEISTTEVAVYSDDRVWVSFWCEFEQFWQGATRNPSPTEREKS